MGYVENLLQKCTSLSHIKQLQAHLIAAGSFHFCTSCSKLLDFCATSSAGSLSYATSIFLRLPSPATNDWNAIIRGLAQSHRPADAITRYVSMSRAACKPDALTCSFALKACARALARREGLQLHSQAVRFGFVADVLLQTTLLDVYSKCGDMDGAGQVFDEMRMRDIATWNALIAGLAQGSRPNEALELFKRMGSENLKPNEVTVLGALSACSQLGAIMEGERVYNYIRRENLHQNVIVCNAVIDMFAKCGFVDKAHQVFDNMTQRNIITWNTMIMAFAMHGDGVKALELFDKMRHSEVAHDAVSYLAVLCACNHAGMVEEGLKLFNSMSESEINRNVKHYGTVVDLLGRGGRLKEAYEIINSMPMMPDSVLWQTLLGASKTYGNIAMAEEASRKLVEMGSNNCGDFVLLSNVYAARERWDQVGKVRAAMKNRDVKKVPGFSYTESEGTIHKFVNADKNHRRWREIYGKIDELKVRIMEHGYAAGTEYVLHDIGEEEKENALGYHSEKLAVAFGLLVDGGGGGRPISVNKNLRICGDCHEVIKLVSKVYGREIIVRDRTRFHRFKDGYCSCGDYW